jgi:hypothetical protein
VKKRQLANVPKLDELIHEVRGQKVMLDFDLARVYGVETKSLNRAVKRNTDRFPKDFMFQVTPREFEALMYQIGTLKTGRGEHRKYLPYVFTEHGAIMAANVLNSARAVQMNTTCGDAVGWTALSVWETGERSGDRESVCLWCARFSKCARFSATSASWLKNLPRWKKN